MHIWTIWLRFWKPLDLIWTQELVQLLLAVFDYFLQVSTMYVWSIRYTYSSNYQTTKATQNFLNVVIGHKSISKQKLSHLLPFWLTIDVTMYYNSFLFRNGSFFCWKNQTQNIVCNSSNYYNFGHFNNLYLLIHQTVLWNNIEWWNWKP